MQAKSTETAMEGDLAFDQFEFLTCAPSLFTGEIAVEGKIIEMKFMIRRVRAPRRMMRYLDVKSPVAAADPRSEILTAVS